MDPSPPHALSPACAFCRRGVPTISFLFHALNGSTICDRCVDLLAQELHILRQETDHLRPRKARVRHRDADGQRLSVETTGAAAVAEAQRVLRDGYHPR